MFHPLPFNPTIFLINGDSFKRAIDGDRHITCENGEWTYTSQKRTIRIEPPDWDTLHQRKHISIIPL